MAVVTGEEMEAEMRNAEEDLKVCNAATRGPWVDMASIVPHGKAYQEHVFDGCVVAGTGEGEILKSVACPPEYEEWEADAAFIALAREALPWWINRAVELETENLRLQKEVDRLLERERHAVHHSETYKRLVERTREVDKVRKEAKRRRNR